MLCPDCGHGEFTADHSAVIRRTYTVDDSRNPQEVGEEIIDVDRDFDDLRCDDCGSTWQPEDLVTQEEFDNDDDDL